MPQRAFGMQHGFALLGIEALQVTGVSGRQGGGARGGHLADGKTIRIGTHRERIAGTGACGRLSGQLN